MWCPPPVHMCIVCPTYFHMFCCRWFSETARAKPSASYALEIVAADKRLCDSIPDVLGVSAGIQIETRRGGVAPVDGCWVQHKCRFESCRPPLQSQLFFQLPPLGSISTARSDLYFGRASLFVTAGSPQHRSMRVENRLGPSVEVESKRTTFCRARPCAPGPGWRLPRN